MKLENVNIVGKHFSGRKYDGFDIGKSFLIEVPPEDAEQFRNLGCKVNTSKTGINYVIVKIPRHSKLVMRYRPLNIRAKIRGENDLILDYNTVSILDYATIRKANITVDVYRSKKFKVSALILTSMEVHISKSIKLPVATLALVMSDLRSQAYTDCVSEVMDFIDKMEVK